MLFFSFNLQIFFPKAARRLPNLLIKGYCQTLLATGNSQPRHLAQQNAKENRTSEHLGESQHDPFTSPEKTHTRLYVSSRTSLSQVFPSRMSCRGSCKQCSKLSGCSITLWCTSRSLIRGGKFPSCLHLSTLVSLKRQLGPGHLQQSHLCHHHTQNVRTPQ